METQKLIPVGQLFKKTFAFYKSKMYLFLVLGLIPFACFIIVSVLNEITGGNINDTSIAASSGILAIICAVVYLVVSFWVRIAYFYSIKMNVDVKTLLKFSWIKLGPFAWVSLYMALIIAGGFILLIIPGIIFTVWFSLTLYFLAFEDIGGMQALKKSKELVKGYWWPVLGRLLLFGIIAALIGSIPVIGNLVNIFFLMPFGVIYGYYIYENLKIVKSQPSVL